MKEEIQTLRYLLWLNHGCSGSLYSDDGEMQCNKCLIDFKRDPIDKINDRFHEITIKALAEMQLRQLESLSNNKIQADAKQSAPESCRCSIGMWCDRCK